MAGFFSDSEESDSKQFVMYNLFAVVVHTNGDKTPHSGHYIAYCRGSDNVFYRYDDENVRQVYFCLHAKSCEAIWVCHYNLSKMVRFSDQALLQGTLTTAVMHLLVVSNITEGIPYNLFPGKY